MNRPFAFAVILVSLLNSRLPAADILDDEFGVKKVAGECKFTEGPAVDKNNDLYFSDARTIAS